MPAPLKISVITVCYNAELTIASTLGSFLQQTYPHRELIVIDGASRDGTVRLVQRFDSPKIAIHSEPDRGLYDAMNKGLTLYQGDAVGFLNADDRFASPHSLALVASALESSDMVSGYLDFVEDHENGAVVRRWREGPYRPNAFKRGWMPAHPTFYIKRHVVEAVGSFDLSYRIAADYDFMLRAHELHGFTSLHVPEVLVHMRSGGKSTAGLSAYLESNREALRSRQRWLQSGFADYALIAKPLGKIGQFLVKGGRRASEGPKASPSLVRRDG